MISTTYNLHCDVFNKITDLANRLNISRSKMIRRLLNQLMLNQNLRFNGFKSVNYQSDDDENNWHCFHIRLREDEYEFFNDLRKISKCSVSLLIAISLDQFFTTLHSENNLFVDNYTQCRHYVIIRDQVDGILCWYLYWGFPEKHLKRKKIV